MGCRGARGWWGVLLTYLGVKVHQMGCRGARGVYPWVILGAPSQVSKYVRKYVRTYVRKCVST